MEKNKKVNEPKEVRLLRIGTLGGFGSKRTQVVGNKKAYNRKKGSKAIPFDILPFIELFSILIRYTIIPCIVATTSSPHRATGTIHKTVLY